MCPCQCKSILHRECLESFIKGRLANKKSLDVCEVCQTGLKLEDSFWDHFCSVFPMLFAICQVFFVTLGMWRLHTEGAFEGGIDWQVYHRLFEKNSLAKCLITLIPPSLLFLYLLWNGWWVNSWMVRGWWDVATAVTLKWIELVEPMPFKPLSRGRGISVSQQRSGWPLSAECVLIVPCFQEGGNLWILWRTFRLKKLFLRMLQHKEDCLKFMNQRDKYLHISMIFHDSIYSMIPLYTHELVPCRYFSDLFRFPVFPRRPSKMLTDRVILQLPSGWNYGAAHPVLRYFEKAAWNATNPQWNPCHNPCHTGTAGTVTQASGGIIFVAWLEPGW